MLWPLLLKLTHIIGAVLGVGGSTLAEVFLFQAGRAGKLDNTAVSFLRGTYQTIRVGTLLLIFSGFGYLLWFRYSGQSAWLYEDRIWMKMILMLIIGLNALLFQQKKISSLLGSTIFFTSWYAALVLGVWRGLTLSLATLLGMYLAAGGVIFFIFKWLRQRYHIPV